MAERDYHGNRRHKNRMVAIVMSIPWSGDQFVAGAIREDESSSLGVARGLERAKAYADAQSGCSQPCDCPPWSESR
jgi:hypothetical protein